MSRHYPRALPTALLLLAAGVGCTRPGRESPVGHVLEVKAPLGLPPVTAPADNPLTVESVELGRRLFYDRRMSSDSSVSCATCHNPLIGFTDGRKRSLGVGGKTGTRNAPSLINSGYVEPQFWDGRARSLEEQAGGPMANPTEMNQSHEVSVSRLEADASYRADFAKAFGRGPVTITKVKKALASFERTLVSGNSPFDRYEYGGDKHALSPAAIHGLSVFQDPHKGNCSVCHTIDKTYALFTDGKFHNIGVGVDDEGNLLDLGRFAETKVEADQGAFKTPSLRNVAMTAPYMHDGSLKTLRDAVDFYAGGGNSNPYRDKEVSAIKLTFQERADLVEFLRSLTGEMPPHAGPPESK